MLTHYHAYMHTDNSAQATYITSVPVRRELTSQTSAQAHMESHRESNPANGVEL